MRICVASTTTSGVSFGILLMQGLSRGIQPVGMDHLSLEVPGPDDVENIYSIALTHGAAATGPRVYGGFYQTFIFDPDGYKIEVISRELPVGHNVRIFSRDAASARSDRVIFAPRDVPSRASATAPLAPESGDGGSDAPPTGH